MTRTRKNGEIFTGNPRDMREREGMTQAEFWRQFGISPSGGCRIETGSRKLSKPLQILLAMYERGYAKNLKELQHESSDRRR